MIMVTQWTVSKGYWHLHSLANHFLIIDYIQSGVY